MWWLFAPGDGIVVNGSMRIDDVLAAIVREGQHCLDVKIGLILPSNPGGKLELLAELRAHRAAADYAHLNEMTSARMLDYDFRSLAVNFLEEPTYGKTIGQLSTKEASLIVDRAQRLYEKEK
ncbi:hypothetical protein HJC10_03990 [Corallococcus exiguus]|uniref:hypothetical protein n=1 Tax=Corallococcus exiguus TaxID=83462 RepID=UPI0014718956|nr:hypothetical protein [Corallococcus exiguus]NNB93410.1 hypothetical protein [Corallococcus exiguus]NNC02014.1 hypothetical protein [Corallococcus exiguus]